MGRFPRAVRLRPAAVPVFVVATGDQTLEPGGRLADSVVLNVGVHPAVLVAARAGVAPSPPRAGLPLASVTLAGLGRLGADWAGSDLVHAARWSQAVSEAVFLPAE